jgi:hypothetical protein
MEISHRAIQKALEMQQGRNPVETLREGQVFSGKAIKLLPGQMAELAALGQKITAQLGAPLQMGERYFFQVASLDKGIQLNVLTDYAPAHRSADQASKSRFYDACA